MLNSTGQLNPALLKKTETSQAPSAPPMETKEERSFFSFIEKDSKGDFASLTLKKKLVFKVNSPAGVSVLADGSLAIVSRQTESVKMFSRTGSPLPALLEGHRKLEKPTNILQLANGKIVVRDTK